MPRFFLPPGGFSGERVRFTPEDARHICLVRRLEPGAIVHAADGRGYFYEVVLETVSPERVEGRVVLRYREETEPGLKIHLFQSLLKGEKMDWMLQKGTEVGISAFHPFLSQRTVVRLEPGRAAKKRARWARIVLEAAKQSERGIIPTVTHPATLQELSFPPGIPALVAWEEEKENTLRQVLEGIPKPEEIALIIGPEGGFSREEIETIRAAGAVPVSLGSRILRAETAGPVMAALILYHYGEL